MLRRHFFSLQIEMDARTQEEFQALRRENDLLREENHTLQEALDRATAEIGTWKRRLDQKKISDALHMWRTS